MIGKYALCAKDMSASETGPYQSKLFNFINRQVQQWGDHLGIAGRHLRGSLVWGTQAVLYPFYLFFEAGRKVSHQFHHSANQSAQSLGHAEEANHPIEKIDSDLPIQEILSEELVHNIPTKGTAITIRGIASLLENRSLVLITSDNCLLDILSQKQQAYLQQSIHHKLSTYAQYLSPAKQETLPPVHSQLSWLGELMHWLQQSPVAITTNLFGEFQNPTTQTLENQTASIDDPASEHVLQVIDRNVAELETIPISTAKSLWQLVQQHLLGKSQITHNEDQGNQSSPEQVNFKGEGHSLHSTHPFSLQELIQAAVDYFFGMKSEQAEVPGNQPRIQLPPLQEESIKALWGEAKTRLEVIKQGIPALNGQRTRYLNTSEVSEPSIDSSEPSLSTETNPFTIRALLWAAIDYFFGTKFTHQAITGIPRDVTQDLGRSGKVSAMGDGNISANTLGGTDRVIAAPWLSWEDVFSTSSTARVITHQSHQPLTDDSALPSGDQALSYKNFSAWESLKRRLQQLKAARSLRTRSKGNAQATHPQNADGSDPALIAQDISPYWDLRDPLDTAFDWVEADVSASGYIKHPLEKILEWLDKLIFWLEQLWEKLWARLA